MNVRAAIKSATRSLSASIARSKIGEVLLEQVVDAAMTRTETITHRDVELTFSVPNRLTHFRVATFSTKEPETLEWIDAISQGSILWDIGANVGLYSCYAAKARSCRVFAFEPSVFNLELLARNIYVNQLTGHVTVVPLPLCERVTDSTLNMTTTQWSGALSSFGVEHGFDGGAMHKTFKFRTVGLSADECIAKLALPYPEYIKMDVDGIEHLILRGATEVLKRVQSIQIEINDAFEIQADESRRVLEASGLRFVSKAHSEIIEGSGTFSRTYNQVWSR